MTEQSSQSSGRAKDWQLTASAFYQLLTWLDEGESSSGQAYLELRRRLVGYFDRKKCAAPEDLADETLNRVARRLEAEGTIETETPAKYCYIVARFVFLESLRSQKINSIVEEAAVDKLVNVSPDQAEQTAMREKTLACLERCTKRLDPEKRDLILGYYIGAQQEKIQNRRQMAESLGISVNALSIRACRIRDRLRSCVEHCVTSA